MKQFVDKLWAVGTSWQASAVLFALLAALSLGVLIIPQTSDRWVLDAALDPGVRDLALAFNWNRLLESFWVRGLAVMLALNLLGHVLRTLLTQPGDTSAPGWQHEQIAIGDVSPKALQSALDAAFPGATHRVNGDDRCERGEKTRVNAWPFLAIGCLSLLAVWAMDQGTGISGRLVITHGVSSTSVNGPAEFFERRSGKLLSTDFPLPIRCTELDPSGRTSLTCQVTLGDKPFQQVVSPDSPLKIGGLTLRLRKIERAAPNDAYLLHTKSGSQSRYDVLRKKQAAAFKRFSLVPIAYSGAPSKGVGPTLFLLSRSGKHSERLVLFMDRRLTEPTGTQQLNFEPWHRLHFDVHQPLSPLLVGLAVLVLLAGVAAGGLPQWTVIVESTSAGVSIKSHFGNRRRQLKVQLADLRSRLTRSGAR